MERKGLDFAGGIPSSTDILARGYDFVVRYTTDGGLELPGKQIFQGELRERFASDISTCLIHETTSDRMLSGFQSGVFDAGYANRHAQSIGFPDWRPIYFAADWDATVTQQAIIDQYLIGAASVIGLERVGVYGGFYVVKRCALNGTAQWFWQTQGWSGGQEWEGNHILQLAQQTTIDGTLCDINIAKQEDFGQWDRSIQMQDAIIKDIWSQLVGNAYTEPPRYGGWPTDAGEYTVVDMLRYLITSQRAMSDEITALKVQLTPKP
ncbi:MAG: glycoside hydrolase domain-containing protein [Pseudonocardiaceae bacterium]